MRWISGLLENRIPTYAVSQAKIFGRGLFIDAPAPAFEPAERLILDALAMTIDGTVPHHN
jgi:hypothetical protein